MKFEELKDRFSSEEIKYIESKFADEVQRHVKFGKLRAMVALNPFRTRKTMANLDKKSISISV